MLACHRDPDTLPSTDLDNTDVAVTSDRLFSRPAPSDRKTSTCCQTGPSPLSHNPSQHWAQYTAKDLVPDSRYLGFRTPNPKNHLATTHNGRLHHSTPPSIRHPSARAPPPCPLAPPRIHQANHHPSPRFRFPLHNHHSPPSHRTTPPPTRHQHLQGPRFFNWGHLNDLR